MLSAMVTSRVPILDGDDLVPQAHLPGHLAPAALDATIGAVFAESLPLSDGIGEWWTYPQASYVNRPAPRTFLSGTAQNGDRVIAWVDHFTRAVTRKVLMSGLPDDHNAPAVSALDNAALLVVWADHNLNGNIYCAVSPSGDPDQLGTVQTLTTSPGWNSYMEVHRLPSDPNQFWAFFRAQNTGRYRWSYVKGTIGVDGVVSWGTVRDLVWFAQPAPPAVGDQAYMASAPATVAGAPGIRFAVKGHPLNSTLSATHYGEINLTTGDVTSPGKTLTANLHTGAGLPLNPTDLDLAHNTAGQVGWVYGVCPDGDPGIVVSSWPTSSPPYAGRYLVLTRRINGDPGLAITGTTGGAHAPSVASFDGQVVSLRLVLTMAEVTNTKALMRRYQSGKYVFQFTWLSSLKMRLTVYQDFNTTSPNVIVDSAVVSVSAGQTIGLGVDFNANTGSGREAKFFTSTDAGATWVQLGATLTGTATSIATGSGARLDLGGNFGSSSLLGVYKSLTYSVGGVVRASQDFVAGGWADADTADATDPDPQGNTWTLLGEGNVQLDGWVTTDLGATGAGLDDNVPEYLGGMAFPRRGVVLLSREAGGVWTIEKWTRGPGGAWAGRVLKSASRPLVRPAPIQGGGPYSGVASDVEYYGAGYTQYRGNVSGL